MTSKDVIMIALVRPLTLNFTEPMVFLLNLYIALIYGLLYMSVTTQVEPAMRY